MNNFNPFAGLNVGQVSLKDGRFISLTNTVGLDKFMLTVDKQEIELNYTDLADIQKQINNFMPHVQVK